MCIDSNYCLCHCLQSLNGSGSIPSFQNGFTITPQPQTSLHHFDMYPTWHTTQHSAAASRNYIVPLYSSAPHTPAPGGQNCGFQFMNQFQGTFSSNNAPRSPLGDVTHPIVNNLPSITASKRKKQGTDSNLLKPPRKQHKTMTKNSTSAEPELLCGVGLASSIFNAEEISSSSETENLSFGLLIAQCAAPKRSTISASDVWYFVRPLQSKEGPMTIPVDASPFPTMCPKSPWIGCRLCM